MKDHSSKLLINEQPLQALPSLAVALGLNEAIFLQQLHNLLVSDFKEAEGRKWIKLSLEYFCAEFPFWSERTIKRIISELREKGLLLTRQDLSKWAVDRTNWYAIDYESLGGGLL